MPEAKMISEYLYSVDEQIFDIRNLRLKDGTTEYSGRGPLIKQNNRYLICNLWSERFGNSTQHVNFVHKYGGVLRNTPCDFKSKLLALV